MLKFLACDDLQVSNLSFVNSPQMHLVIHGCQRVNVTDLRITSPATSPNTDGIHVDNSQHVGIDQSAIATGAKLLLFNRCILTCTSNTSDRSYHSFIYQLHLIMKKMQFLKIVVS